MAQTDNERTVVGVFEDFNKADRVVRDLQDAGIPRDSIQLQSNFMTGAAGRSGYQEEEHREGGISGFFHRLFGDDNDEAGNYAEAHRRGHAIVCVSAPPDQIEQAVTIMNSGGAIDIDRRVEQFRQAGYRQYDPNAEPYNYDQAATEREHFRNSNAGTSIPVVEEELQVGKRTVRRGGVRVYSRVVEEPANQKIELREEHVRVDRRPADRNLTEAEMQGLRDQSIVVEEMIEEPVVRKRSRVREEVVVAKETTSRTENVSENLRRTEVEVEHLDGGDMRSDQARTTDYTEDFRRDWESRYANSGDRWEDWQPAYEYGYRTASDPQYHGRDWSDVEDTLRTDYLRRNLNSNWDRTKGAVRYGWEKLTGKR
ncbi:MAG: YsnF/AvaK domain-containing protein [Candidatus Solibacter sp.]